MDEKSCCGGTAEQRAGALETAIAQYGAYVLAVIRNRSRGVLTPEDHEEIASDVFLALWRGAKNITRGQLRPWLGAVARKRTAEAMRKNASISRWRTMRSSRSTASGSRWSKGALRSARAGTLGAAGREDREIFYRFYDLSQTTAQIAQALGLNASTVRSRLLPGREALRKTLTKGGLFCEDDVG